MSNETTPSTVPNFRFLSQAELRQIVQSKSPYAQIAFDYLCGRNAVQKFGLSSISTITRRVGLPPVGIHF